MSTIRRAVIAAAMLCLLPVAPASAASVTIDNLAFIPEVKTVSQGTNVSWTNDDTVAHTATRAGTIDWDTGNLDPGETSGSILFKYAAKFPYVCTIHGTMAGQIRVPVRVSPSSGTTSTTFTITVGTTAPPSGHVFDVQWRKGSGDWKFVDKGTRDPTETFRAGSRGNGTYRFRSRVRETASGLKTPYSRPKAVTVG